MQHQICRSAQFAQQHVVENKAVKLMSVHGQVAFTGELPKILLVHRHSNQMRHDMRKSLIVVAFHPYHLDFALRVRKFADIRKKIPVVFLETAKIQVTEDITEKNQTAEGALLQHFYRICRAAQP